MIIKKYKAQTEKEAILMAREDLGPDAIVMNVKTIKPAGLFKLFKKSRVELTAAIDDNISEKSTAVSAAPAKDNYRFGRAFENDKEGYSEEAQNAIEEKINSIAKLLEQQMTVTHREVIPEEPKEERPIEKKEAKVGDLSFTEENKISNPDNKLFELIYNQLIENEVKKEYVDMIIDETDSINDKQPLDNILSSVYQKIVLKLGEVEPLKPGEDKPKIVFFVGNTGVGKTTTMAKIASKCVLEDKLKIAMFSVDTYRIAAIEQTKTYANIINVPMEVIYTPEDMKKYVEKYKDCDLILVDTAGRSHRNEEQKNDLQSIIDSVKDYEKEVYLVVSVTVKYKDLLNIAKTYGDIFDYKLIFTKLDETKGLGSILNLKLDMDKKLSYVTWGQNVPDDIGVLNPQVIAKKLLGGAE
ncbi:MAG: flagellar biosynthesis protein FlhF [Lachnospiraceae bacterium]|nr:flagellar biosynthesis protein FlhF [Lachnospiraceae bacterium]